MNLIGKIYEQMCSDDADREKQSEILLDLWRVSTADEKEMINAVMLTLCGWTMRNLIRMTEESSAKQGE